MRCDGTLTGALGKMHPCPSVKTNGRRCGSVSATIPVACVKINRDLISNGVRRQEDNSCSGVTQHIVLTPTGGEIPCSQMVSDTALLPQLGKEMGDCHNPANESSLYSQLAVSSNGLIFYNSLSP